MLSNSPEEQNSNINIVSENFEKPKKKIIRKVKKKINNTPKESINQNLENINDSNQSNEFNEYIELNKSIQ